MLPGKRGPLPERCAIFLNTDMIRGDEKIQRMRACLNDESGAAAAPPPAGGCGGKVCCNQISTMSS